MTIVDDILDRAGGAGTLTVAGADPVGWARLHDSARRMATVLAAAGVGRGSRVGLLGEPSTHLVAALQSVWLAGASVTVLPPPSARPSGRAAADRLGPVVADAGLDPVIVDDRLTAVGADAVRPAGLIPLSQLVARARDAVPAVVRRPEPADLAVLQYTSGSTRFPRGVPVRHAHLAAQLVAIRDMIGHDPRNPHRMLSWLPLHHDMGLIGFLCYPMASGCSLVLLPPARFVMRPATWLTEVSRHRSTVTGGPNSAYRLVAPLLAAGLDVDLRSVRLMISGGEPVDPTTTARFTAAAAQYGLDPAAVRPAYGLAEATLTVTCAPAGRGPETDVVDADRLEREGRAVPPRPDGRPRTLTRLGRPVRGVRVRIVDPAGGAPVDERVVGEVEVAGASVVGHYRGEPAPPAGSWLRTGDLGYLAEGDLVLCGRRKDVLFAAGRNLYPPDIEAAVDGVPGVRPGGAVAFGVPGEHGDDLVVAVEARVRAGTADRAEVIRAVTVAVTGETGMRPARVLVLPPGGLPRTTSGKLRRAEARRRYLDAEPTVQKGHRDDPDHPEARTGAIGARPPRNVAAGTRGGH
ncbi:AMP-binding protein [Virgisporangium aurantiacum]|uniref:Putative ligase n=1 Tax=Virgisporangium aurantiacum TaxID=175570 RepID=A0A8J4E2S2_9ACTN|nr:AMP-binding protein [Virgisporangium aurantiacum]GIJ57312.1 putative ligase [Virgisporangium aurantiacum]